MTETENILEATYKEMSQMVSQKLKRALHQTKKCGITTAKKTCKLVKLVFSTLYQKIKLELKIKKVTNKIIKWHNIDELNQTELKIDINF